MQHTQLLSTFCRTLAIHEVKWLRHVGGIYLVWTKTYANTRKPKKNPMPMLFADRVFRLAYNSTQQLTSTCKFTTLHCCSNYTSNMAVGTVVNRMTCARGRSITISSHSAIIPIAPGRHPISGPLPAFSFYRTDLVASSSSCIVGCDHRRSVAACRCAAWSNADRSDDTPILIDRTSPASTYEYSTMYRSILKHDIH